MRFGVFYPCLLVILVTAFCYWLFFKERLIRGGVDCTLLFIFLFPVDHFWAKLPPIRLAIFEVERLQFAFFLSRFPY